jgi:hypothetical protein
MMRDNAGKFGPLLLGLARAGELQMGTIDGGNMGPRFGESLPIQDNVCEQRWIIIAFAAPIVTIVDSQTEIIQIEFSGLGGAGRCPVDWRDNYLVGQSYEGRGPLKEGFSNSAI